MDVQAAPVKIAAPKFALCIDFKDAPHEVRKVVAGTHRFPVREEFFSTPVRLVDRAICETDPSTLQLLPYAAVVNSKGQVFKYSRGKGGTEARLHAKQSIGIGGHMEQMPENDDLFTEVKLDLAREVEEELGVMITAAQIEIVALIYNPTGVNQVHLGILCYVHLTDEQTAKLMLEEGVIENGEWVNPQSLLEHGQYGKLEDWSHAAVWYLCERAFPATLKPQAG